MKKEGEKYQQFNRAYRLQEWVEANLLVSEEQFLSIPDDKVFTLGHLNYKYVNSRKETVDCVALRILLRICLGMPYVKQNLC